MNKFLIKVLLNGIVVIPLLMWYTEATFVGQPQLPLFCQSLLI
ncbi:hypothetical protein P7H16_09180 [Paenibacillus larvae]|nr:hypothetical protein [Paenibacillus larvae]MDT2236399.1 hypothetical protein [Paenibacillus larvae]MDT2247077.1 hypothetical protein [Paenibacillus larvae]MDT2258523.1 hypothetical protein [Paenibacillus larvae]